MKIRYTTVCVPPMLLWASLATNKTTTIKMKTSSVSLLAAVLCTGAVQAGTTSVGKGPALAPAPAPACPDISYNNVGAAWVHGFSGVDGVSDSNGVGLDASFEVAPHFYLRSTGVWQTGDVSGADFDFVGITLGAGYAFPVAQNLHLVLEAGGAYDYIDVNDAGSNDDFGFYIFPHLRAKLGCLEIHAGAKYLSIDGEDTWEGVANLYYPIVNNLDFAVGGGFGEDSQSLEVGLRYRF